MTSTTFYEIRHGKDGGIIQVDGKYKFSSDKEAISAATSFKENPQSDNKHMSDENAEYWKKQVFIVTKTILQNENIATI